MNKNFNEWYIDANISPTSDLLESRSKGIDAFAEDATKEDICELVAMYYGITADAEFKERFSQQFINFDPSFSARYTKELSLLAGATLVEIVRTRYGLDSLVELLVVINSAYHQPLTTPHIANIILQQFDEERRALRENLPDDPKAKESTSLSDVKKYVSKNGWSDDSQNKLLDTLMEMETSISNAQDELLVSLSIFKEDSQILWWMTSQWSNLLKRPLKDVDKSKACLLLGAEAAQFIANFPGPYAMEGVIKSVVNDCKGKDTPIPLYNILQNTDSSWKEDCIRSTKGISFVALCPLHAAIIYENNTASAEQWYPKYQQEFLSGIEFAPLSPTEYAWRMYLENLAIGCYNNI